MARDPAPSLCRHSRLILDSFPPWRASTTCPGKEFGCAHAAVPPPGFNSRNAPPRLGSAHAGKEADRFDYRVELPSAPSSSTFFRGKVRTKDSATRRHSSNWRFGSEVQPFTCPRAGGGEEAVSLSLGNVTDRSSPVFSLCGGGGSNHSHAVWTGDRVPFTPTPDPTGSEPRLGRGTQGPVSSERDQTRGP